MSTFVHTLIGARPPSRADGIAWAEVRIERSDEEGGPWTEIETQALAEVAANPREPGTFDLTFDGGAPGYFRLVFLDSEGAESDPTEAILDDGTLAESVTWAPSIGEVSALLRARTKVRGSKETGIFNDRTRPTGLQVERLIRQACRRVSTSVGREPCTEELRMDAGAAAAFYTAMLIEQSYYPEQTSNAGSSFKSLESLWKDAIATLKEAVHNECGGEEDEGAASGPGAAGHFDDGLGLISRGNPPTW